MARAATVKKGTPVPQSEVEVEETQAVGVFVQKVKDEEGNIRVEISPLGVEVTEVQTLLELGLKAFRDKFGLGDR